MLTLPLGRHPPRQTPPLGRQPPGQTPPRQTAPDSHCSGRYASYWNAFLLVSAKWTPDSGVIKKWYGGTVVSIACAHSASWPRLRLCRVFIGNCSWGVMKLLGGAALRNTVGDALGCRGRTAALKGGGEGKGFGMDVGDAVHCLTGKKCDQNSVFHP